MTAATASDAHASRTRVMAAGVAGNIVEWYDFALYGYMAPITAQLFFPASDPLSSLLGAFGVFAIGALARPFGGVLFGHIGDRMGRRLVLTSSVLLMGVATFLMGLLPTYATLGVLAPALLVVLRLAQGVSTGGEFTGSITFLVEHAPPGREGLYGSFANFGAVIGGALGAGTGWLVTEAFSQEVLQAWGWRIPFLLVLPISLLALWIRLGVDDAPGFVEAKEAQELEEIPLRTAVSHHKAGMATVFGLNWVVSAGYFIVFVWLITDMTEIAGLSLTYAMGIGTVGLLFGAALTPLAGHLSDLFGRKVLLGAIGVATLVGAIPLLLAAGSGSLLAAISSQLVLGALIAGYLGIMPAVFALQLPVSVRCSGLSLGYNSAVALFGGTAPLVATWLVKVTGWDAAPGLYLCFTALVGLALLPRVVEREVVLSRP